MQLERQAVFVLRVARGVVINADNIKGEFRGCLMYYDSVAVVRRSACYGYTIVGKHNGAVEIVPLCAVVYKFIIAAVYNADRRYKGIGVYCRRGNACRGVGVGVTDGNTHSGLFFHYDLIANVKKLIGKTHARNSLRVGVAYYLKAAGIYRDSGKRARDHLHCSISDKVNSFY